MRAKIVITSYTDVPEDWTREAMEQRAIKRIPIIKEIFEEKYEESKDVSVIITIVE